MARFLSQGKFCLKISIHPFRYVKKEGYSCSQYYNIQLMILNPAAPLTRFSVSYSGVRGTGPQTQAASRPGSGIKAPPSPRKDHHRSVRVPALRKTIPVLFFLAATLTSGTVNSQFYYKDLLIPAQTTAQLAGFQQHRIRTVKVLSYERDGEATEGFSGSQHISNNYKKLTTQLQTAYAGTSTLTSFFDQEGRLLRSIDTTDGSGSISHYSYNEQGLLTAITNVSTSFGQSQEKEEHHWYYSDKGRPQKMLRIKNTLDTTNISFVLDEKGKVIEEVAKRKNTASQSFYYYYDEAGRLTDIASYNNKAGRILPAFIFEYDSGDRLRSMMVVPEGSDDYQKWYYSYNTEGMKVKEECRNKRGQLLGRIEYQYSR